MNTPRIAKAIVPLAALAAAGCASPIHIVTPTDGLGVEPQPQVVAQFNNNFKPTEAWGIYLDGVPITGFSPPPAPLGTSTAPLAFQFEPYGKHTIQTNATCGTFCSYNSEEVTFYPPELFYNGTTASNTTNLQQFKPTPAFVGVQFDRSVPITVTVQETSSPPRVKLGNSSGSFASAGTPITVTIPSSSTKGDFFILGDTIGTYQLAFSAAGVTPGGGFGNIAP